MACFAEVGPNDVSVRAIAERAGVNHGLVHHYFGSKAGLVDAVVRDVQEYFAEALASGGGVSFMTTEDPRPLIAMRAMARIIVDGAMPTHQAEFPVMAAAANVVQNLGVHDVAQSRLLAAQVLAMLMGWSLFEPFLVASIGRNLDEAPDLRSQLRESALRMVTTSVSS
jgi:AcrR family transcriptional regulator